MYHFGLGKELHLHSGKITLDSIFFLVVSIM